MDLGLAGRAYYVTGGSRGIGGAIVRALLDEGASVATCARDGAALAAAHADLPAQQRARLVLEAADVLDAARTRQVVDRAFARLGRLDGLVANAGAGALGAVLDTPASVWSQQFASKVHGVLNLVRAGVGHLGVGGSIVLVNGVTAQAPELDMAATGVARAAARNLALALAAELAARQVRVNTVALGPIITQRQRDRFAGSATELSFERWCAREAARRSVPLGRLGVPEDVTGAVLLLLSPRSAYTTGASLDISGGLGARF